MDFAFENWGFINYTQALQKQELLVESVHQKQTPPTLIFCTHPPLVTKGRATQEGDITHWDGPVYEINRGGRATYHGPNQLMIYPIIPLYHASKERAPSDVGSFLRQFELAIVDTLRDFGIEAQGKSDQRKFEEKSEKSQIFSNETNSNKLDVTHQESAKKEETGVWVGDRKIASLGLSIRHWITFHGAALNVEHDPKAFQGIKPCGFSPSIMTSIEELLGTPPNREYIISLLTKYLQKRL